MQTKITKACLELIFANSGKGWVTVSIVAWMLIGFQVAYFPWPALVAWAVVMTGLFAFRGWFGAWVMRRDPTLAHYDDWYLRTFLLVMAQAVCWGFSGFFFYPPGFSLEQAFHVITITGVGPIAVSVNAPDIRMVHAYLLVTQLPLFARTLMFGDLTHGLMAVLILLNLIVVWMNGIRMNGVIVNSFRLRFTNEDLIEELRRAKQEAEDANRAKSEFLARMSHEIRTPMNAILGFNAILQADEPLPHQRERLEIVHSSATSLLRLLDNILDVSKVEAGQIHLERAPFDPEQVLVEPAELASALLGERPVEIVCDLDNLPRELIGDGFRVRQVVINLLGNAVKFTQRGFIRLSARMREASPTSCRIALAVADTGMGIPAEHLQKIFEPFTQADESVSRRFGGTGLGLTISRRLVRLMGGDLAVASEPGRGTRFSCELEFPRVSDAPPPSTSVPFARVMLLDDVKETADVVTRLLQSWGCTVVQAATVVQALSQHAIQPFDLFCIDLTRPGVDPRTIARQICPDAASGLRPRLLGFTALADTTLRQAHEIRFDALCRKPVRPSRFGEILRSLARPLASGERETPRKTALAAKNGLKILIAEDNPVNQKLMLWLLKRAGHETETVEDGNAALARIRAGGFDLVIMDVSMPELDGIKATGQARREGCTVPIVICSASAMKEDIERAHAAGANGFLSKPYEPEQLLATVVQFGRGDA